MIKNSSGLALAAIVAVSFGITTGCRDTAKGTPDYQGVIELDEWVLGFEVGGKVAEIPVERGRDVKAGERLALLDASLGTATRAARVTEVRTAEAQVALLRAGSRTEEVRSMDAQVRAARATEELLEKNLARERALEGKGASTVAAVEDLEGRLARAVAERQVTEQRLAGLRKGSRAEEVNVAEARAEGAAAVVNLEDERLLRNELVAPAEGVVLDVHVKAGEVVAAGTPVVTVGDPRHPYADVFVPQGKLEGIRVGLPAEVRIDAASVPLRGKVETIARKTEFTPRYLFSEKERSNLVVRVRVRIEDPGQRFHAGVPAFVVFGGASPKGQGS
jgi:HlyD family secretion protein